MSAHLDEHSEAPSPPADIAALERLLLALGALAEVAPRIAEIDLNPVIVHPNGEGISLIDARCG